MGIGLSPVETDLVNLAGWLTGYRGLLLPSYSRPRTQRVYVNNQLAYNFLAGEDLVPVSILCPVS